MAPLVRHNRAVGCGGPWGHPRAATAALSQTGPDSPEHFSLAGVSRRMNHYECDCCGACCRRAKIELSQADIAREPDLTPFVRTATVRLVPTDAAGNEVGPAVATRKALAMVTDGPNESCRFLADNRCRVHATRPDACRLVPAGGDHCQRERRREGLPPLTPIAL